MPGLTYEFLVAFWRFEAREYAGRKPSEVEDTYWLYAVREPPAEVTPPRNSGKWLVFVDRSQLDEVWETIAGATREGRLGDSSKVSTAMPNPNALDPGKGVICVYTNDWEDVADVRRVREELRRLGVVRKIPYKADEDTARGRYQIKGHTRISKYYE